MMKKYAVIFSLFFLSGCAYLGYIKDPFVDIPVFYKVDDGLYRGGRPKTGGLDELKALGIKTFVDLRGESERAKREREWARDNGIAYYQIPMTVYEQPTEEQAIEFLEIVLNKRNKPVFIHCSSGRDRTGTLIAMYRVVVNGWTIKQAYKEARKLGFFPYHGEEALLKVFIHQLKDKPQLFQKARDLSDANKE